MVVKMTKLFRTRRRLVPLIGAFFLFLASSTVLDITRVNSNDQWSAHQLQLASVVEEESDHHHGQDNFRGEVQSVSDKAGAAFSKYHYKGQLHSTSIMYNRSSKRLTHKDDYSVRTWLPRGIKERRVESSSESDLLPVAWSLSERHRKSVRKRLPSFRHISDDEMSISPEDQVKNVVANPVKRLPQALIIGVKKCGTRALLEFLRLHPDIRAAGPETHFFDKFYNRKLDWYKQQMPPSLSGQITMEKTPSYFITRDVPERIHAMSPKVKLLVVVRDPVTRALSDYTQTASKRREMAPFEKYAFLNDTTGLVDTTWSVIKIGVYARYLEWWLTYFPLEQIHFISGESLVREPAAEMALVQDFLGLKRVITDKHFYFNETKGFPCLKKSEGNGSPHCLGKSKGRTHPDISAPTVQRLRQFYRPFNVKFYQMVNRNFGWP